MNLKLRVNPIRWVLLLIVGTNLSFLYLIDIEITFMGLALDDIALIGAMIWGIYYWFKMSKLHNPPFTYGRWIVGFILLGVLSAIQSNRLFGQSFLLGFRPHRLIITWGLLYFLIRKCIHYGKLSFYDLKWLIQVLGFIQLVLFISQYFIYDKYQFLYANTGNRYGSTRFYFLPILLDLLFMVELDEFVKKRGIHKVIPILFIIAILFEVIVVQKFRLTSMGLVLCFALFIFLEKSSIDLKIAYIVIGAIAMGVLMNTELFQDVLHTIFTSNYDNGMKIRDVGRELYLNTFVKHPILGGGYPSIYYAPAQAAVGVYDRIYLYDNGIFGFMYLYGSLGLIWVGTLWFTLLKKGWHLFKKQFGICFLLFPLFFIITCINECHWYWEQGFVIFSLFLCYQETACIICDKREKSSMKTMDDSRNIQ